MATARETILKGPFGNIENQQGLPFVRTLFKNLVSFAAFHYSYAANAMGVNKPQPAELLARPSTHERQPLDCASMAMLFNAMLRENLQLTDVGLSHVSATVPFATAANSSCFDAKIVGNVRTLSSSFEKVRRCVFSSHIFSKVGASFYDPCLVTQYQTEGDVKSWQFVDADANSEFHKVLYRVQGHPATLIIRIPAVNPPPHGFETSFLQVHTADLRAKDYEAAFGGHQSPCLGKSGKSIHDLVKAAGLKTPSLFASLLHH